MIPGPDIVVACPKCGALARHPTLISGYTVGSQVRTDGKRNSPTAHGPPHVAHCPACDAIYWTDEARQVGDIPVDAPQSEGSLIDPAWQSAPVLHEPAEESYITFCSADPRTARRRRRSQTALLRQSTLVLRAGYIAPTAGCRRHFAEGLGSFFVPGYPISHHNWPVVRADAGGLPDSK